MNIWRVRIKTSDMHFTNGSNTFIAAAHGDRFRGASSAFVFNELLRCRCIFPITVGRGSSIR